MKIIVVDVSDKYIAYESGYEEGAVAVSYHSPEDAIGKLIMELNGCQEKYPEVTKVTDS